MNGYVLWSRTAHEGVPQVKRHVKASHANCTPATDGRHVVVSFGSEGLYCYDFTGRLLWKRGLGYLDAGPEGYDDLQWGYASSPCLFGDRVIVQCDTRSQKFLAAFDVETGQPIWRVERDDHPTFSSPTVHVGPERTQVIVNGYARGYLRAAGLRRRVVKNRSNLSAGPISSAKHHRIETAPG
ncbi:MAG: PQQ-binding-like beta-propeller repeat protein [Planctomycetes bacterium]|nr:PQQ-binding-like beta-propeller repeat protein [Planctomycetota bacterium]